MSTPIGSSTTPPTSPAAPGTYDDAVSSLYLVLSELRQSDVTQGEDRVEENETEEQQQEGVQRTALQQAQANQANAGHGFFASVGDFFSDVASDVAHGRLGSAVDDAKRDLDSAWNSPQFWGDLEKGCEGLAIVAAAVVTTVATFGTGSVAAAVVIAAAAAGAAAGGGAGAAAARSQHFAATATDANADATAAGDQMQELQQLTTDVLAEVKQTDQSHQRALQSLVDASQTADATVVAPTTMTVQG